MGLEDDEHLDVSQNIDPTALSGPAQKPQTGLTFSYYTALCTAALTAITFGIAICTPPLSGPFCRAGCFQYPFLEIASRFPRDYIWMYPAILATSLYLVLMVCINAYAKTETKIYSQSGLAFAIIASGTLILDYYVQISVIQQSVSVGETDGISLLTQFNPHGLFIALEEIGFIMMSVSFLCVAPVFSPSNRIERIIRRILVLSFAATVVSFLLFTIFLGMKREYFFEVTAISVNWLALIALSVLCSIVFKRKKGAA